MIENANDMVKMVYAKTWFDIEAMCAHTRYVYEIFPDGKVIRRHFEKGSRKAIDKEESNKASSADFHLLCAQLNNCISTADREETYIDDTSGELVLYRAFGRKDILPRGYGNENDTVGNIVSSYLHDKAQIDV